MKKPQLNFEHKNFYYCYLKISDIGLIDIYDSIVLLRSWFVRCAAALRCDVLRCTAESCGVLRDPAGG